MSGIELVGLRWDAADVNLVSAFWAGVLQCGREERPGGVIAVVPRDVPGYELLFTPAPTPKAGQNRIHLDVTSASEEAQAATVERALALGGSYPDIGYDGTEGHVVLADPEGNELCVIEPGSRFLAGTGVIGAINCDGTAALGRFWSDVLGWPLVWEQDEETAIQASDGGSKVTWSGPPLMPRHGRDRLRFVVTGPDPAAASAALVVAGARVAEEGAGESLLLDPDGNEFHLVGRETAPHRGA